MKRLLKEILTCSLLCVLLGISLCSCGGRSRHKDIDESKYYKVDVRSSLNIRERPSAKARKLGSIPNGTVIQIEEIEGKWARLNVDGYQVYVSSKHIVPCDHNGNPRTPTTEAIAGNTEPYKTADAKSNSKASPKKESVKESKKEPKSKSKKEIAKVTDKQSKEVTDEAAEEAPAEIPGPRTAEGGYKEVYAEVRDSAGLFNNAQAYNLIRAIEDAKLNITVVTVPEVANDKFFSFADDVHSHIEGERSNDVKIGKLKRTWHAFLDNFYYDIFKRERRYEKEHYTMVYDAKHGLLSIAGAGPSGKLMEVAKHKENFAAQTKARNNAYEGIITMIQEYGKAKVTYREEYGWWKKGGVQSCSLFDYLSDEVLVQNMLPNDSFWHKYIFGPITKYPLKFTTGLVGLTGSLIFAMIILGILFILLDIGLKHYHNNMLRWRREKWERITVAWSGILVKAFLYVSLATALIYAIPSMEKIIAMENGGYSAMQIKSLLNQFNSADIVRSWPLITFFIIGLIITALGDSELLAATFLGETAQSVMHERLKENSTNYGLTMGKWGYTDDLKELDIADKPFTKIYYDTIGENIGKNLGTGVIPALIINPGFMLIAGVRMWITGIQFVLRVHATYRHFERQGFVALG